jgi:glycosyltransferase involved in cell wall biosynthesis
VRSRREKTAAEIFPNVRALVIEQAHHGHPYTYVRRLVEALRELTSDIVVALTPQGIASPEFRTHLAEAVKDAQVLAMIRRPRPGIAKPAWDAAMNIRRAVREVKPDVVYVPTADGIAEATGLVALAGIRAIPRGVHAEALMTRLTFAYPGDAQRRSVPVSFAMAGLRHAPFHTIHLVDVLAFDWLQQHGGKLAARFRVAPDPVDDFQKLTRADARKRLEIPVDGRYIVCPGILIARKGIDRLAAAFLAGGLPAGDRLLLCGPVGPEIQEMLQQSPFTDAIEQGKIVVVDRVLGAQELGWALCAADLVACPYPWQPHPSSIAVKALACERPVLGADNLWLGYMVPRFGMGWTTPVNDPAAFAQAIRQSLDNAAAWQPTQAGRRLVQFQSVENFKACWMQGIRSRMGLPALPLPTSWQWVSEAMKTEFGHRAAS